MNCYYCGSKLEDAENFCVRCGKEAKEIVIDYDKLNFNKEKQAQNESAVLDNTKADSDISKETEDIFNSIISEIQTDNVNDPPYIDEQTKKETGKDLVEEINEKPVYEIIDPQKNEVVDSDKVALPKSKKPIKVVVKTRKKR